MKSTQSSLLAVVLLGTACDLPCNECWLGPALAGEAAPTCTPGFSADGAGPQDERLMDIGSATESGFRPFPPGTPLTTQSGDQGLDMYVSLLRIAAKPTDQDGCMLVMLKRTSPDAPDNSQNTTLTAEFVRDGDFMYSDGLIFDPIEGPRHKHFRYEVTARAEAFMAKHAADY